jgi:hypothetical protein
MTAATDRALVAAELVNSIYPSGGLTTDEAWLGIYQVLLWYEHGLPHIIDANELQNSQKWRDRAVLAEQYIASELNVAPASLASLVDRMMMLPRWAGKQRNNPLGNGFRTLLHVVLEQFGNTHLTYEQEAKAAAWFPGIRLPGRSNQPSIDILALAGGRSAPEPKAVISCKWSNRHDRSSDPTNECPQYKSASIRMGRSATHLKYIVATAEMYDRRVEKLTAQECVDYVAHLHLPLFIAVNGGAAPTFAGHTKLIDITDLIRLTHQW